MSSHPQVLLLGNGINRTYGGTSWTDLMKDINVRKDFDPEKLEAPMPMQAILLTNNNLKDAMKNQSKVFRGEIKTKEQGDALRRLLTMGFDDILTTNYSYELESAALGTNQVKDNELKRILLRTQKVELRYLLHTCYALECETVQNRIWHIHGESRIPDSMILGHYWYGNMLGRIKEELKTSGNRFLYRQTHNLPIEYNSWVDSFILGDVYVLGFGFDLAELDLWWLLNRKAREKAEKGRVVFYEIKSEKEGWREKTALLKLFGACVRSLDFHEPNKDDPNKDSIYKQFYEAAISDISKEINSRRS